MASICLLRNNLHGRISKEFSLVRQRIVSQISTKIETPLRGIS